MIKLYKQGDGHIDLLKRFITDSQGVPHTVKKVYCGSVLIWENQEGYGVRWIHNHSGDTTVERIGNTTYHRTLPIHNKMKRCILGSDGSVRYVSDSDWTKDTDGNTIDYTKTSGLVDGVTVTYDVMVEIPEHYYESGLVEENGITYDYLMLYPYAQKGKKVPKHYVGAFEAMLDRTNNLLFSTCKTNIVYNNNGEVDGAQLTYAADASQFKGGTNVSTWDSDSAKTLLGRPATNITISNFCNYAIARGTTYANVHWESKNCINRLFLVEYATFNTQDTFTDVLTQDGYHQGGLGFGICSTVDAWSGYNSYNPVAPTGVTLKLGSKTGNVRYNLGAIYSTDTTYFDVPSYRGIENPFAHIWENTNGMYIVGADSRNYIFTAIDGWNVRQFNYGSSSTPITGYELRDCTTLQIAAWPSSICWDQHGDILPKTLTTGSSGTDHNAAITHDYFWGTGNSAKKLMVGGDLSNSVRAGLFALSVASDVGNVYASRGSRLLSIPNN